MSPEQLEFGASSSGSRWVASGRLASGQSCCRAFHLARPHTLCGSGHRGLSRQPGLALFVDERRATHFRLHLGRHCDCDHRKPSRARRYSRKWDPGQRARWLWLRPSKRGPSCCFAPRPGSRIRPLLHPPRRRAREQSFCARLSIRRGLARRARARLVSVPFRYRRRVPILRCIGSQPGIDR